MKPKKLNLQEITKIYFLLRLPLDGLTEEMTIGEGIQKILDETKPQALLECINILYDNSIDFDSHEEFVVLFINALVENDFFRFVWFMKEMNNDASTSR